MGSPWTEQADDAPEVGKDKATKDQGLCKREDDSQRTKERRICRASGSFNSNIVTGGSFRASGDLGYMGGSTSVSQAIRSVPSLPRNVFALFGVVSTDDTPTTHHQRITCTSGECSVQTRVSLRG